MSLGSRIKAYRRERGMTQEALAYEMNVTQGTVSRWERGVEFPNLSLSEKMRPFIGDNDNSLIDYISNLKTMGSIINQDGIYIKNSPATVLLRRMGGLDPEGTGLDSRQEWSKEDWELNDKNGGISQIFKNEQEKAYARSGVITKTPQLGMVTFSKLDSNGVLIMVSVFTQQEVYEALRNS